VHDAGMGDDEDLVMWSMTCNSCDNEWMQTTPDDSDPAAEEIECPKCASTMLDAEYAGRQ
jgi:DNA-directed RNA polymerase subunit RPC12/RpoP